MDDTIVIGIVEDDIIICESIIKSLSELGYTVLEPANSYDEAILMMETKKPDFVLIDIILGNGKDGIDLAETINQKFKTPFIYLTANADKATVERAKKTIPSAYLLKPFTKNDLYTSIEVAITSYRQHLIAQKNDPEIVFIKDGNTIRKINIRELYHIESDHVYVRLITKNSQYLIRNSLQQILEQLNNKNFIQTHRSHAVNLMHLKEIRTNEIVIGDFIIPVSRNHKPNLLKVIKLNKN